MTGFWDDTNVFEEEEKAKAMTLDEGEYAAVITDTNLDLTGTYPRARIQYDIFSPDKFKGKRCWSNYKVEGKGKYFLKRDLVETLGIAIDHVSNLEELGPAMFQAVNRKVKIFVKLSPKDGAPGQFWENVYLNGLFNQAEKVPGAGYAPSVDTSEEIPF